MRRIASRSLWRIFACAVFVPASVIVAAPGTRQPLDLVLVEARDWVVTANSGSRSVSLVDIRGGFVVGEIQLPEGFRPFALALSAVPEIRLLVLDYHSHQAAILSEALDEAGEPTLVLENTFETARLPAAAVWDASGSYVFVASEEAGAVDQYDRQGQRVRRYDAVEGARRLAWGGPVATGERPATLVVVGRDAVTELEVSTAPAASKPGAEGETHSRLWVHRPFDGKALNLDGVTVSGDLVYVAHQVKPGEAITQPQMIVWGLILSNRVTVLSRSRLTTRSALARAKPEALAETATAPLVEWSVPLDQRHRAAGDPRGPLVLRSFSAAERPKGARLDDPLRGYSASDDAVADNDVDPREGARGDEGLGLVLLSAGTDRLVFVDEGLGEPKIPLAPLTRETRLPTIDIPGRPTAMVRSPNGTRAYVASQFDDAVFEIDLVERALLRRISLGTSAPETPELRGARLFHDSRRSRGGWYSCHSCHRNGGTDGFTFDTTADGAGLAKRSPPLFGVTRTGPWAWMGTFHSLEQQVAASLEETMAVDAPPTSKEVADLLAFLDALTPPKAVESLQSTAGDIEARARGARLFRSVGCDGCHVPPLFTSARLADVGTSDPDERYNPPSLLGVRDRYRFLHDARAHTLEDVFRRHNDSHRHGRAHQLSDAELADLLAYLRGLGGVPRFPLFRRG